MPFLKSISVYPQDSCNSIDDNIFSAMNPAYSIKAIGANYSCKLLCF